MADVHFLPWIRRGLASLAEGAPDGGETISLELSLTARRADGGGSETRALPGRGLRLMGPGDVVALTPDQILRRDPAPGAVAVEPNYFASVELAAADLPWRYTPGGADAMGRLRPWLALVVVEVREGVVLTGPVAGDLAQLEIDFAGTELPDLKDAWAWAHVQYEGGSAGSDTIAAALEQHSPNLRARLICPRRLDPGRSYWACLVPTFKAGRSAGLGAPGSTDFSDAWTAANEPVTLPVYAHWRFESGPRGDFESLVRRLSPREMGASVGVRRLRIDDAGSGLPTGAEPVLFGGALMSPDAYEAYVKQALAAAQDRAKELRAEIAARVNAGGQTPEGEAAKGDPVVAPPAYGRAYRPETPVADGEKEGVDWLSALNTRPEHRVIAGLGADVVRRNQEEFIDLAWDSVGDLREANTQMNLTRMAAEVGQVAQARFDTLDPADRLRLSAPALSAMPGVGARTAAAQVANSALPDGLLSGAARRIMRPATGLASEGGVTQPGRAVVAGFLDAPLGSFGVYRDQLDPAGLDPDETPNPQFDAGTGPDGTLYLAAPDPAKRARTPFKAEDGTNGLVDAVTGAQDPHKLLSRSLRDRVPGLTQADEPVPPALQLAPRFSRAVYHRLREVSLEYLLPGAGNVPPDTVTLLLPNTVFMRAFLAGMNHEMGREFLWREFPTPLDATWFRSFWKQGADDIPPIANWGAAPLWEDEGTLNEPDDVIFVLRGALPRRYPDLRLYATKAVWKSTERADGTTQIYRDLSEGAEVVAPDFAGQLTEDMFFFGFRLSRSAILGGPPPNGSAGYFFVFEETPAAPRFGLEVVGPGDAFGTAPANWGTISWANVTPADAPAVARFVDLAASPWMSDPTERPGNGPGQDGWAEDAASFARQCLQRPVKVLMHGSALLNGGPEIK